MPAPRRALVLAGGGYVASSWEIGLLAGLADAGLDVRNADLLIGTSAGARVALDLASGKPLDTFYRARTEAATSVREARDGEPGKRDPSPERPPAIDWAKIRSGVEEAKEKGGTTADILRRMGTLAMSVAIGNVADRRRTVTAQLPLSEWPEREILIAAVDAETGERRAFDRRSGIDLIDAVIATTASFGAPLVPFAGRTYFDGGYYSSDNADLALGYDRVLILALRPPPQAMRLVPLEAGVEALRASGSAVETVHPDAETLAALAPTGGIMNPASGKAAAIGGRAQGRGPLSGRLAAFWR